jgi:hypothetical protein
MAKKLISSLYMALTADTTGFQTGMNKAERRLRTTQKEFKRTGISAKQLGTDLGSLSRMAMNLAGPAALGLLAKRAISTGSAITDMAKATNTGIEELQVLQFAARDAGASNEQMMNTLVRIQKSASDASRGLSTATDAFDKLGINVDRLMGMKPEEMLTLLATKLHESKGDVTAYGAALDLLGTRNAPKMMEVLERLATDGFAKVSQEARAAGQIMSEDVAKDLDAAADKIERFTNKVTILMGNLLSLFQKVGEGFGYLAGEAVYGDMGDDKFLKKLAEDKLRSRGAFEGLSGRGGVETRKKMIEAEMQAIRKAEMDRVMQLRSLQIGGASSTSGKSGKSSTDEVKTYTGALDGFNQAMTFQVKATKDAKNVSLDYKAAMAGASMAVSEFGLFLGEAESAMGQLNQTAGDPKWMDALAGAVTSVASAIEDGLVNAAQRGKIAFEDMARFIMAELMRIFIRSAILQPLFAGIGGLFPTGSSLNVAFTGAYGGGRASGGPVHAGTAYTVGESGPEMFVPKQSGTIIPNMALGGGGTYYIDATGADSAAVARLEQTILAVNGSIEGRAQGAVQEAFRRNPSFMRR